MAIGKLSVLLITKSRFAVRSVLKNSNGTASVILLKISPKQNGLTLINFDVAVESLNYCIGEILQELDILSVSSRPRKVAMLGIKTLRHCHPVLIQRLFIDHLNGAFCKLINF